MCQGSPLRRLRGPLANAAGRRGESRLLARPSCQYTGQAHKDSTCFGLGRSITEDALAPPPRDLRSRLGPRASRVFALALSLRAASDRAVPPGRQPQHLLTALDAGPLPALPACRGLAEVVAQLLGHL